MIIAHLPKAGDIKPVPSRDGNSDGGRSGEGADTALEILIRKRREAEKPVDLDDLDKLGDLIPPEAPVPPPA